MNNVPEWVLHLKKGDVFLTYYGPVPSRPNQPLELVRVVGLIRGTVSDKIMGVEIEFLTSNNKKTVKKGIRGSRYFSDHINYMFRKDSLKERLKMI